MSGFGSWISKHLEDLKQDLTGPAPQEEPLYSPYGRIDTSALQQAPVADAANPAGQRPQLPQPTVKALDASGVTSSERFPLPLPASYQVWRGVHDLTHAEGAFSDETPLGWLASRVPGPIMGAQILQRGVDAAQNGHPLAAAAQAALLALPALGPEATAASDALPEVSSDAARYARAGEDMQTLSSRLSRVAGDQPEAALTGRDWLHTQLLKHQLADLTQERAITAPPTPTPQLPPPPGAGWYDVETPSGVRAIRAASPQDALTQAPGGIIRRYQAGDVWQPFSRKGSTGVTMMGGIAGVGAGAAAGGTQGNTPEERLRNAAVGAVSGGLLGVAVPELASRALGETPATEGSALARAGAIGDQPNLIASGLSKDDAVAQMKDLSAKGQRAQMQRADDGTFSIIKRGEAQPKVPTLQPTPTLAEPAGQPTESGFQSRLMTALRTNPNLPKKPLTLDQWQQVLATTPGVPPAEFQAVRDKIESLGHEADWQRATNEMGPLHNDFSDFSQARSNHFQELQAERAAQGITSDQLAQLVARHSPVADLERTVLKASSEPKSFNEAAARAAARAEVRDEMTRRRGEYATRAFREINGATLKLADEYGLGPARHIQRAILRQQFPALSDLAGTPAPNAVEAPAALAPSDFHAMLPAATEDPSRLFDAAQHLASAHNSYREAIGLHNNAVNNTLPIGDVERVVEERRQWAGVERGDTQYSQYQRIDPSAPYREILIRQPGLGTDASHFGPQGNDVIAHARGELQNGGKDYVMIEGQSDAAHTLRQRPQNFTNTQKLFEPTDRWAQLATAASLRQAAEEGADRFLWSTEHNRMQAASLNADAAHATYGVAIPKAVKRIFAHLGIEHEPVPGTSTTMGVKLSPEARRRILTYGVPALGLGLGFLPAQARQPAPSAAVAQRPTSLLH